MCSVINIEFERNNNRKISYRSIDQSRGAQGDDDFLTDLQIDDANLMLVDDLLEYVKNERDLENGVTPNFAGFNDKTMIKIENGNGDLSPTNGFTTMEYNPDGIIDPNDFFNDMYKSEVDYSSTFSSPSYRNTPSPTTSNSSQNSSSDPLMDYNSSSNQSESSINLYPQQQQQSLNPLTQILQPIIPNYHLDTPPISPPTDNLSVANVQTISYVQPSQSIAQPIPVINNIIQGTLIPITAVQLPTTHNATNHTNNIHNTSHTKKVKIQPKPIAIATKPISSSIVQPTQPANGIILNAKPNTTTTPKRIVLSENDYKALMLKCKSQQNPATDKRILKIVAATPAPLQSQPQQNCNNTKMTSTINTQTAIQLNAQPVTTPNMSNNRIQIASINQSVKQRPKQKSSHDEIDERTLKKQMRMIKNRESACLSRKKKKEYVTTLEAKLMEVSKENQDLKSENSVLKERLSQMASKICDMCGNLMTDKTGLKSSEMLSTFRVPKKNAAFLLAFVFMVSMNVGPFFSQRTDLEAFNQDKSLAAPHHTSRGLLWVEEDADITNTSSIGDDQSNEKLYPMCPVLVNQTESIRLATELQRWIGDIPEYFNLTKLASNHNLDLKNINDYLLPNTDQATIKTIYKQMRTVRKYMRKTSEQLLDRLNENDRRTVGALAKERRKSHLAAQKFEISKSDAIRASNENRVQIYQPAYSNAIKYAALFEEIHRQNDTFYVVSFRGDHLLLPALAHNNAFRPKMSLMLPTFGNVNDTEGIVTLMQIDCEVVNTSMIRIKESSIPDNLKNRTSVPSKHSTTANNPITTEPLNVRNTGTKTTAQSTTNTTGTNTLTEQHGNMTDAQNGTNFDAKIRQKSTTFENVVDFENEPNVNTLNKYKPYVLRNKSEKTLKND